GRATAASALAALAEDLQGHEPLSENLSTIATLADTWRVEYAEPEIDARRTQGQEAASRLVATGAGRSQFDQLRGAVDSLGTSIAADAQAATDAAARARGQAVAALIGSVAVTATVSVASALILRRWVVQPLEALADAV